MCALIKMSTKTASTFVQSPTPLPPQTTQSSDQQQNAARIHSITTVRPSSITNIFHSISSIHRSASALPVSLLDLDVASSAGLQNMRNIWFSKGRLFEMATRLPQFMDGE
ncbi:hypothetical protein ACTXT7_015082 [Hymenolepis weldensis]